MKKNPPELLAPAGNWECAKAAVANGANAVYFGLPQFNARLRADNFTLEELPELVSFLHKHQVRAYVALNTLIFTNELPAVEQFLIALQNAGVDAIIVQDLGLVQLAQRVAPDVEIHASTQMTITSPEGARWAKRLGAARVVLARETSLREMERFQDPTVPPIETFVHGALCVAYSGQCLTSESLGQRSANRGECAQACRLPYQLLVDGVLRDLGNRRYLLSPQDLAAVDEIPELIRLGVQSFKIEGRLKAPEYVAAICQVYRKAIDIAVGQTSETLSAQDRYQLEMTFSRGLFSGWMHGVNHQQLVQGTYSNKRGPTVGIIADVGKNYLEIDNLLTPLQPGDGLLLDDGRDQNRQQGGRLYEIEGKKLFFQHGKIRFELLKPGMVVYKTDDPQLDTRLKRSYSRSLEEPRSNLDLIIQGRAGENLVITGQVRGESSMVTSEMKLISAERHPLSTETLRQQLGRLGDTLFCLGTMDNQIQGKVIIPIKELNRLRRILAEELQNKLNKQPVIRRSSGISALASVLPVLSPSLPATRIKIIPLCRSLEHVQVMLEEGAETIYIDFEDIRRYPEAVNLVRALPGTQIYLATPRIQKATELGFFKLIAAAKPDGVLIRNLGAIDYFRETGLKCVGDFSLNVANPLTAQILIREGLERVTISYDLNIDQVQALLRGAPPDWFEIVLHQHMPMFHMEHCVFAAFLSKGTDFLTCGRPCDRHDLRLRDRVGIDHPVMADVGCRNTVYHGKAQTGAFHLSQFRQAGVRNFRIELLRETAEEARLIYRSYSSLLMGKINPNDLVQQLHVVNQLGVTSGTLTVLS